MKYVLPFSFLLLFLTNFTTAAESKTDLLLKDETLLIVHIDFTRLDAKEIIGNNKALLLKLIEDSGFNRPEFLEEFFPDAARRKQVRNYMENPEELARLIDGAKTFLTTTMDIRQVYYVVDLRIPNPVPIYFAIPKPSRHNAQSLRKAIPPSEFVSVSETEDFLLVTLGGTYKENEFAAFLKRMSDDKSAARPELREAIREVEKYPIYAVLSVPKYAKRVIRETQPFLPEEFKNIDVVALTTSLSWTALGIDPAKSELHGVSAAESQDTALRLHREIYQLLAIAQEKVYKNVAMILGEGVNEYGVREHIDERTRVFLANALPLIGPDQWKSNAAMLFPEPQGNRFAIHWTQETFERFVGVFTPLLAKGVEGFLGTQREAARRMICVNNMKTFGIAMHTYYDAHKTFPPAYTLDAQNKPLHSWRVHILPFMGKKNSELYNKIRKEEPWDSEYNRQFHDQMPVVFACPSMKNGSPKRDTPYCMVVGKETLGTTDPEGRKFAEILDGLSNTIMFVERKTPVCWMSPVDITQEEAFLGVNKSPNGIGSPHIQGVNVTYCDGSVHFISETIDPETLRAYLTIAGGEKLP